MTHVVTQCCGQFTCEWIAIYACQDRGYSEATMSDEQFNKLLLQLLMLQLLLLLVIVDGAIEPVLLLVLCCRAMLGPHHHAD